MNSKVVIRGSIYGALALITFLQGELPDFPELNAASAKQWLILILGTTAAVLIPIRAFIDQTVSRENGNGKEQPK